MMENMQSIVYRERQRAGAVWHAQRGASEEKGAIE